MVGRAHPHRTAADGSAQPRKASGVGARCCSCCSPSCPPWRPASRRRHGQGRHQLRRRSHRRIALPADRPAGLEPVLQRLVRPAVPLSRRPAELHHVEDRGRGDRQPTRWWRRHGTASRSSTRSRCTSSSTPIAARVPRATRLASTTRTPVGLGQADARHLPSADRERAAGGDPPVGRRRAVRRRRPPDRDPGQGPGDPQPSGSPMRWATSFFCAPTFQPGGECGDPRSW